MPIVSSQQFPDAHLQADGSRTTRLVCVDSTGKQHALTYKLPPGGDAAAVLVKHVAAMNVTLAEVEVDTLGDSDKPFVLGEQTADEFAERFFKRVRQAYKDGDKPTYSRLIWRLHQRILAGDLTSNQVRQAYNSVYSKSLNPSEWNTLVSTVLLPISDAYDAIVNGGEL